MRMIDEKKLIDKLKDWIRTDYFEDWSARNFILNDIIAEINKMPKVGEWIPVSERLPDADEYILVSFENFSVPMIGRYAVDDDGGTFRVGDKDDSFVQHVLYVNAWQPLPEPYREESAK